MGKLKGLFFTGIAALGGYAAYMANKNKFSDETKEQAKKLADSAMNFASKAGDLLASTATDMIEFTENEINKQSKKRK